MKQDSKNIIREPQPDYEKAEMDLLREALKRSPSQRFDMLMGLMKIGIMMKNAKIIHSPFEKVSGNNPVI